jgi:hypothetical protein
MALVIVCAMVLLVCAAFLARMWQQGHHGDVLRVLGALAVLTDAGVTRHGFWSFLAAMVVCPALIFAGRGHV